MSKTLLTGLLGSPRSHRPSWNRSSPKTAPPRGVQTRSTPLGRLYGASTTYLPEERRLDARLEAVTKAAALLGSRLPRVRDPAVGLWMAHTMNALLRNISGGYGALDVALGEGLDELTVGRRAMDLKYSNIGDYAVYRQFSYTRKSHDADLGVVKVSIKEKETVDVPTWAGVAAIGAGAVLLLLGRKR